MPLPNTPRPGKPDPDRDTPMPAPTWKPRPIEEPEKPDTPIPNPDENDEPERHAGTPPRPVPDPEPPIPQPLPPDPGPEGPIPSRLRSHAARPAWSIAGAVLASLLAASVLNTPALAQSNTSTQGSGDPGPHLERDVPIVRKDRPAPYGQIETKTPKAMGQGTDKKSGANAAESCYLGAKDKTEATNAQNDDADCK